MSSVICSHCGDFGYDTNPDIRGHDYPCSYSKDGVVVVIAKGNSFAGFKAIQ